MIFFLFYQKYLIVHTLNFLIRANFIFSKINDGPTPSMTLIFSYFRTQKVQFVIILFDVCHLSNK